MMTECETCDAKIPADREICAGCQDRITNGGPGVMYTTSQTITAKGKTRIEVRDGNGQSVGAMKPTGSRYKAIAYRPTGRISLGSYGTIGQAAEAILADTAGR